MLFAVNLMRLNLMNVRYDYPTGGTPLLLYSFDLNSPKRNSWLPSRVKSAYITESSSVPIMLFFHWILP